MLPSIDDWAPPTTSPSSLTLSATFNVPPRLPRSVAEPSFSQSTACAPLGFGGIVVFEHKPDEPTTWPKSLSGSTTGAPAGAPLGFGGIVVFEHKPDEPTTWPKSLIPIANPTVSPVSGGSRSEERRVGKE